MQGAVSQTGKAGLGGFWSRVDLNINYKYLQLLLAALPKMSFQNNEELLDSLLPWNPKVQEVCKIK